jgi:hypothetical protein
MIQKTVLLAALAVLFGLWGCNKTAKPWLDADVSDVEVEYKLKRLSPRLYEGPRSNFQQRLDSLYNIYPDLVNLYTTQVIGIKSPRKDTNARLLEQFIYDPYWQKVYKATQDTFPNLKELRGKLTQAFKHYRHYYPKDSIPDVYTLVKGIDLRYKVATLQDKALIIFLDMYLGQDYKFYISQYPDYRIERLTRENIVPDVVETLFQEKYPEDSLTNKSFLSKMLYRGKKLHFMKSMLPSYHDTAIMRYSLEDWNWCLTFEEKIWNHFVNQELLFETNDKKYTDFLKEAPFTSAGGIPPESPPRLGAFVGFQIIREYRRNASQTELSKLIQNQNYQQILTKSGYSP